MHKTGVNEAIICQISLGLRTLPDASWLHADEFVQPIGKKNGYGIVVQDDKLAAVKIVGNRKIEQL